MNTYTLATIPALLILALILPVAQSNAEAIIHPVITSETKDGTYGPTSKIDITFELKDEKIEGTSWVTLKLNNGVEVKLDDIKDEKLVGTYEVGQTNSGEDTESLEIDEVVDFKITTESDLVFDDIEIEENLEDNNIAIDTTGAKLDRERPQIVMEDIVVGFFDENLNPYWVPYYHSDFLVTRSGYPVDIKSLSIKENGRFEIKLVEPVRPGERVTISYYPGWISLIDDSLTKGNNVEPFTNVQLTNFTGYPFGF